MLAVIIIMQIIATVVYWQLMSKATKRANKDGSFTALHQLIAGITILAFIPLEELRFATDWKIWLMFVAACVFYAINDRIMTPVYRNLPPSQVAVLQQFSSVFVIIIGLVIFKEPFSLKNIIAGTMIITGNVIALYERDRNDEKRRRRRKYALLAVIAGGAMSIALSLDIDISTHYNLAIYAALSLIIPSLFITVSDRTLKIKDFKKELTQGKYKGLIGAGIALGIKTFTMLRAYQIGDITVVAPLLALSFFVNILYELIVLKERNRWKVKILVSVMIFVAVIIISM